MRWDQIMLFLFFHDHFTSLLLRWTKWRFHITICRLTARRPEQDTYWKTSKSEANAHFKKRCVSFFLTHIYIQVLLFFVSLWRHLRTHLLVSSLLFENCKPSFFLNLCPFFYQIFTKLLLSNFDWLRYISFQPSVSL